MDEPGALEQTTTDGGALRRDARANQLRILAAAVVAVRRHGPSVPMARVAADAGVGVGTLYRRFPTREALMDALTRRSFEFVLDAARAAELTGGLGLDCLDHFLDATIGQRDELILPLHGGPAITSDTTREARTEVHRTLQRIIDRGRRDGSIRDDATPRDIVIFGAMLAQPLPTVADWGDTSRRLKRVYLDGLAPARPPREA